MSSSTQTKNISWQQEILQPDFLSQLQRLASRRFGETSLAEEAYSASLDKMLDTKWQENRLATYRGKASTEGFLRSVFKMLLEDFSRARFGRPRPPAWLKRLGSFYVRVFVMLCLERLAPEALVEKMGHEQRDHNEEKIVEAISVIRLKIPRCGEYSGEVSHDFNDEAANRSLTKKGGGRHTLQPEDHLAQTMLTDVLQGLAIMLGRVDEQTTLPAQQICHKDFSPMADNAIHRWHNLGDAVRLQSDERLLLKMVYQDGMKVAAVARLLREKDHIVRRRLQDIVTRLRHGLEEAGVTAGEIREVLR